MSIILAKSKIGEYNEIQLEISNIIINIIEQNSPHKWMPTAEPFVNKYNGKISYDMSGKVCKMSSVDLKKVINKLEKRTFDMCYRSPLEALLEEVKTDKWIATYQPNCGRHWISYNDILDEKFRYWKYNNLKIDNKANDEDKILEEEMDDAFYDFIENTSYKFYSAKLLMKLKK